MNNTKSNINPDSEQVRKIWGIIGLVALGYGLGGGLSNIGDHGFTLPILLQMLGGIGVAIIAIVQWRKGKK